MVEHWRDVAPPPYVSLAQIARAHGVKAPSSASPGASRRADADEIQEADPFALQAMFGQAEIHPYRPPRKGLLIN